MHWAMGIAAFLCTLLGVWPALLYRFLPNEMDWGPYTLHHLGETIQILALAFTLLLRNGLYPPNIRATLLDTDWFYRVPLKHLGNWIVDFANAIFDTCGRSSRRFAVAAQQFLANPVAFWRSQDRKTYDNDEDRPTIAVSAFLALVIVGIFALWVSF